MKFRWLVVFAAWLCNAGLAGQTVLGAQSVQVAAAANLANLEKPLQDAFERTSKVRLVWTFSSSGALVTQIVQGAPYQVFLSADIAFAQKLVDGGWATGAVKPYAVGRMILLSTKPMPAGSDLRILLDPAVVHVAIANPEVAPYGAAALQALVRSGIDQAIRPKLVTASSIAQALQMTLTAADFGFVNKSALKSPALAAYAERGRYWFEVDPTLYTPLTQGFVVLKSAANDPATAEFAAFLTSKQAREIFVEYGYALP